MPEATFPARFESLKAIGKFVTRAASKAGLDDKEIYQVELAVDEACSNIIEHAYGGETAGEIRCTCEVLEDRLQITLRDNGASFDPQTVPEPEIDVPLFKRKKGGLGLYLIRQLMDEVGYRSSPSKGNTLEMIKYRKLKGDQ